MSETKCDAYYGIFFNPLSAIGKYTDPWKFDLFMVLDP